MSEKLKTDDAKPSIDSALIETYARDYRSALTAYFIRRTSAPEIADDLVQEVFMRLVRRKKAGEIDSPSAYVMQTASSVWADHLRTKQRRAEDLHVEYDDFAHSPEGFSPERVYENREALRRILALLDELPERTQDIYLLCRFDGLKRQEAAERFGISVSAVDKHLMAATRKIGLKFGDLE